jgi:imidazolonepropionase-like amidohydrolase
MKKYFFLLLCQGVFLGAMMAQAPAAGAGAGAAPAGGGWDSASFYLHKFAQNIGKETYRRRVGDSGVSYAIRFKFVDRGMAVPLDARLLVTAEDEPLSFWVNGSTSRFSKIHDSVVIEGGKAWIRVDDSSFSRELKAPAFPVGGYSPGTVQMELLRYWRRHGRPAKLALLPTGSVSIREDGFDTLALYGQRLVFQRMVINGLVWGNELVWTDLQGNLICLITNDAEGDKLEMMLDRYEPLLPELIGRAATYGMRLFAEEMKDERKSDTRPSQRGATGPTGGGGGGQGAGAAGIASETGTRGGTGTLAIVDGKLVDVATGEITEPSVILIQDGRIVKAGAKASVVVPAGAKVIHAEGKTILPGLWDMHAHFEQAEWGPAYLAAGVTTVRDVGNEFNYINAVKRAIDDGTGLGPHILKAGIIDGPGPMGLGIVRAASKQEAVVAVRRYKDSGFVQIKIYSSVQPPVVRAICDEAHRLGLTVTGHIPNGMNLEQGVDSGMDMVNHIEYVADILAKDKDKRIDWGDPKTEEGLSFIKEHEVVIDPTLGVFEMIFRSTKDSITKMEPAFYSLPEPLQVLFVNMGMEPVVAEKYRPIFKDMEKLVKVLHDRGVPIVAGTDMGFPGYSVDRELELYVEAGLTPLEAIRTATLEPALVMKLTAVSGSLMAGRMADLIIVNGDPLHHIRDIRKVQLVIKGGRVYDPVALHRLAGFSK